MKNLLTYLVTSIVDSPDQVEVVEENDSGGGVNLYLTVATADMGKVIGKEGRVIRALRDVVRIWAIKNNLRSNVVLKEV